MPFFPPHTSQDEALLGQLAMKFRGTRRDEDRRAIARAYAESVDRLIRSGSWQEAPAPEEQLPDDWMPKAFFEYWTGPPPNSASPSVGQGELAAHENPQTSVEGRESVAAGANRTGKGVGRVWFINPNEPEQPAGGVYRWFYLDGKTHVTLYVGKSTRSTLNRGIEEAKAGGSVSSDKGEKLDTDFIVGSAIRYLKTVKGLDVYWRHEVDDPAMEEKWWEIHKPILQDGKGEIKGAFRLRRSNGEPWKKEHRREGEEALFEQFAKYL